MTFLAFDTETTGFYPLIHLLVEVGAVLFRFYDQKPSSFQTRVNPEMPVSGQPEQMHSITNTGDWQ